MSAQVRKKPRSYWALVDFLAALLNEGYNPSITDEVLMLRLGDIASSKQYRRKLINYMNEQGLIVCEKEGWVRLFKGHPIFKPKTVKRCVAWKLSADFIRLEVKAKGGWQRRLDLF